MGFWSRLKAWASAPSSYELWYRERRWHHEACLAIIRGDKAREIYCLEQMAACQAELDRRGVTHL